MDSRIAAAVCVVLAVFAVNQTVGAPQKGASGSTYTTKYDSLNIDQILASKRLVGNYVRCLIEKQPCPPEGEELKRILPEALEKRCEKCNATQKNAALKVIDRLQKDYPDEWKLLLNKWDPKGEHFQKFQKFIEEEKKKGPVKF